MVTRRPFTLLEVLVALTVLMLGFGFLMGQFALSSGRLRDAGGELARTRELVNAAEFTLLAGPKVKLDKRFLTPERYRVTRSWRVAASCWTKTERFPKQVLPLLGVAPSARTSALERAFPFWRKSATPMDLRTIGHCWTTVTSSPESSLRRIALRKLTNSQLRLLATCITFLKMERASRQMLRR